MKKNAFKESLDLDAEMSFVKNKLKDLRAHRDCESPLNLSAIKDFDENLVSVVSSSIIDIKINDPVNTVSYSEDKFRFLDSQIGLTKEAEDINQYEEINIKELEQVKKKLFQNEIDLKYCISQNKQILEENQKLKKLIEIKDDMIENLKNEDLKPSEEISMSFNCQLYSEIEMLVKNILES